MFPLATKWTSISLENKETFLDTPSELMAFAFWLNERSEFDPSASHDPSRFLSGRTAVERGDGLEALMELRSDLTDLLEGLKAEGIMDT